MVPFPDMDIVTVLNGSPQAKIMWVQEEPKNMGAWRYASPRLTTILNHMKDSRSFTYVGRPPSASTATGQYQLHLQEMKSILQDALQ